MMIKKSWNLDTTGCHRNLHPNQSSSTKDECSRERICSTGRNILTSSMTLTRCFDKPKYFLCCVCNKWPCTYMPSLYYRHTMRSRNGLGYFLCKITFPLLSTFKLFSSKKCCWWFIITTQTCLLAKRCPLNIMTKSWRETFNAVCVL